MKPGNPRRAGANSGRIRNVFFKMRRANASSLSGVFLRLKMPGSVWSQERVQHLSLSDYSCR